ncbi:MAG: hypothetical protein NTX57_17145 [Armatimonadetes bacterium]|nr:hypothetical protein [Armatimonadota bacterium]
MDTEESVFAQKMQEGLRAPAAPEHLHRRLQVLVGEATPRPRRALRNASLALAPALVLAGAFYVRAKIQPPPPAPLPVASAPSPDPNAAVDLKHPLPASTESIPEPGTLCLLAPGLLLLRYRRSQIIN